MFSANRCPFLRTIVWISDSKLLQFINLEYYAFGFLHFILKDYSLILEDIFWKNEHQRRMILKNLISGKHVGEYFTISVREKSFCRYYLTYLSHTDTRPVFL